MADEVAMDPVRLREHAEVFRDKGVSIIEFTNKLVAALWKHDPSNAGGDEVGKALQSQYFDKADQLMAASRSAGELLVDMADLVVEVAYNGAVTEQRLTEMNDDLVNYDPKVGSQEWSSGDGGNTGSTGYTGTTVA